MNSLRQGFLVYQTKGFLELSEQLRAVPHEWALGEAEGKPTGPPYTVPVFPSCCLLDPSYLNRASKKRGDSTYMAEGVLSNLVEDLKQGRVPSVTESHEEGNHGFTVWPPKLHVPF